MSEPGDIAEAKARYDRARSRYVKAFREVARAKKAWRDLKSPPFKPLTLEAILWRFAEMVGPDRECSGYFSGNDLFVNVKTRNADIVQLEVNIAEYPHWPNLNVDLFFNLYMTHAMRDMRARIAEVEAADTIEAEYTEQMP